MAGNQEQRNRERWGLEPNWGNLTGYIKMRDRERVEVLVMVKCGGLLTINEEEQDDVRNSVLIPF